MTDIITLATLKTTLKLKATLKKALGELPNAFCG